jgi:hypothetical protein
MSFKFCYKAAECSFYDWSKLSVCPNSFWFGLTILPFIRSDLIEGMAWNSLRSHRMAPSQLSCVVVLCFVEGEKC